MLEESGLIAGDNYVSEEFIISEIFYNEVLYLPLDRLDLSDSAGMETIIKRTKDLIPTLKVEEDRKALTKQVEYLEKMMEQNKDLKDVTISHMSWQDHDNDGKPDHPYGGMQAAVFTKGEVVNVVFRGTPDESWIDNAEIEIGTSDYSKCYVDQYGNTYNYLSPMLIEGLEYVDKLLKENGDKWADKILTAGGHSKGDALAVLVTFVKKDAFDICFGINGPAFSPEIRKEIINNIGIEKFIEIQKRIRKLNESNDYVSPFGDISIYAPENIRWCAGFYNPKSILSAHYVGPLYNIETGKLTEFTDGPGPVWLFIRSVYLKIEQLPPTMRKPACYGIMSILQFIVNSKLPVGKDIIFYEILLENIDISLADIEGVLVNTMLEKEGMDFLDHLSKVGALPRIFSHRKKDGTLEANVITKFIVTHISICRSLLSPVNRLKARLRPRNTDLSIALSRAPIYKTGKATISYSEVDGLITKLDFYIEEVERRYIKPATDAKDTLSAIAGAGSSKSSLNTVIQNYKNIKTGLETYKDLLNQYKVCCEETEDRFIKNLQETA